MGISHAFLAWIILAFTARGSAAPAKQLTKAERLVNERILALLEWATERPASRWHSIGPEEDWNHAALILMERGIIEIRQPMNQYRLKQA